MLYLFDNIDSFTDELLTRSLRVIPTQRRQKALQYRFVLDRKLAVIAYLLLTHGLNKEYKIDRDVIWQYSETGKPYLTDYPEVFFNISHCKSGVVCVIAQEEVGIDIEEVTKYDKNLAKYVCNDSEYNKIASSLEPALEFCKLWTAKESLLKFTGQGICTDLKNVLNKVPVTIETMCSNDQHYVISLCKRGT